MTTERPTRPTVQPILQESAAKLRRQGFDPAVHSEAANQGRGPKRHSIDGAGVVWAVIAGLAIWLVLICLRPMWTLMVQVLS
jgi:hypothetical protein